MTDPDADPERPELFCRHLILCRTIWYDAGNPDEGYSLGRVIVHIRPPEGHGFGYLEPRLFLYVQLFGDPGEYTVRVRLARIETTEDSDVEGNEGEMPEWGPWDVAVTGDSYVESFGIPLVRVPFDGPGVYEFQLWADGFGEPVARERVEARE